MTLCRCAQRPDPEGVWPKLRVRGVAQLDRGTCHGAVLGVLLTSSLGHKRDPRRSGSEAP